MFLSSCFAFFAHNAQADPFAGLKNSLESINDIGEVLEDATDIFGDTRNRDNDGDNDDDNDGDNDD